MDTLLEPLQSSSINEQNSITRLSPEHIERLRSNLQSFYTKMQDLPNTTFEGEIALLDQLYNICLDCSMANAEDVTGMEYYLDEMAIFPQLAFINNLREILETIQLTLAEQVQSDLPSLRRLIPYEINYDQLQRRGFLPVLLEVIDSEESDNISWEMLMSDLSDVIENYETRFSQKYFEFASEIKVILKSLLSKFEA